MEVKNLFTPYLKIKTKRVVLSMLLCLSFSVFGQIETYENKEKLGLKVNNEIIYKAKADSILILDDTIATIYKKQKIYYVNLEGKKVFKRKITHGLAFHDGTAVVMNRKNKFGAINNKGDLIANYYYSQAPTYFGRLLVFESWSHKFDVYSPVERLMSYADSIRPLENWLIIYNHSNESYTYTEKRFLRPDKTRTGKREVNHIVIYHIWQEELVAKDIKEIVELDQLIILKNENYQRSIYQRSGKLLYEKVYQIQQENPDFISFRHESKRKLLRKSDAKTIIEGTYTHFQFNPNTIYAYKDSTEELDLMDIYSKEGELKQSDLYFIRNIERDRAIFAKDTLQFIGTEEGDQLSQFYVNIEGASENFRLVYKKGYYTYINDNTYAELNSQWPLLAYDYPASSGGRRRGGFLRAIFTGIGNFGRALVGKPRKSIFSHSVGSSGGIGLYFYGELFQEGFAKVCVSTFPDEQIKDEYVLIENQYDIRYNYIDTSGALLNSKKYIYCYPFVNGVAMVKEGKYYYGIDRKGNRIKGMKYLEFESIGAGYYQVKIGKYYGLMSPAYKLLTKCKYWSIYGVDGTFYGSSVDGKEALHHYE